MDSVDNLETASRETCQTRHDKSIEKGTCDPTPPPFSNGFFDKDPITSKARAEYLKLLAGGTAFLSLIIWGGLTIYWGALWKTEDLVHHLNGWIVVRAFSFLLLVITQVFVQDFDGAVLGSAVSQQFAAINAKNQMTWHVQSADLFPNGPSDVAHAVVEQQCWVAIVGAPISPRSPILPKPVFFSQCRSL
jgi:hypothetical protein